MVRLFGTLTKLEDKWAALGKKDRQNHSRKALEINKIEAEGVPQFIFNQMED